MGWLGDWWYKDDPTKAVEIDKSLEEFLRREKPRGYEPAAGSSTSKRREHPQDETYSEQTDLHRSGTQSQSHSQDQAPETQVPSQSLFQDGRYKHLWATYRPQKDIESATKSDQDRMMDIARGWKQRTADIGHAASENCAEESLAVHDCFRNGNWKSKVSMCREENKALSRCVTMQRQFLNALGYMSIWDRTPEETEKIQIHADRLYHRMLEQEKIIAEAKEKGEPSPQLPPILDDDGVEKKLGYKFKWDDFPEEFKQKQLENRLKGLEGPALEVGKKVVVADVERRADAIWQTNDHYHLEKRHRVERYLAGRETVGDRLRRWWDTNYLGKSFPDNLDEAGSAKPMGGATDKER